MKPVCSSSELDLPRLERLPFRDAKRLVLPRRRVEPVDWVRDLRRVDAFVPEGDFGLFERAGLLEPGQRMGSQSSS